MRASKKKNQLRVRRKIRVRSVLKGTAERPRLSIFRSNYNISAQLIDDTVGKTLVSASSMELKGRHTKTQAAEQIGKLIAEKAVKAGVKNALADRGSYRYHGRVKALIESARTAGLTI